MRMFLGLLVPLLLLACGWCWLRAVERWRQGRPLLEFEPRRPVPWGLVELVLTLLIGVLFRSLAVVVVRGALGDGAPAEAGAKSETAAVPEATAAPEVDAMSEVAEQVVDAAAGLSLEVQGSLVFAGAVASLLTMFLSAFVLRVWSGATWSDLGLSAAKVGQDLRLGLAAFVMLAPPVYAVQLVLVQWFESKHPLIELLKQQPSAGFFLLSGFAAVLVAPVVEEYLFRMLLQGWLERVAGRPAATGVRPDDDSQPAPVVTDSGSVSDAYRSPLVDSLPPAGQTAGQTAWWPILVSSAVFSLLHFSHGPDWVPLFLLALGLGYLYSRTHRLLPAITVHFLLNSLSMLALATEVYGGG